MKRKLSWSLKCGKYRGPHSPKSWKIKVKVRKIVMALENFDVSMQRWLKISSNT
jgi:hypothetical protein